MILNMKTNQNNPKEYSYKQIDETLSYLHDILYFIDYFPKAEYHNEIVVIYSRTKELRNRCIKEMETPLIALKNYTEGKCSWERAGSMCDLHIWGLRKYCEDKKVNCNNLRIDEYYGIEGDEGIQKIKKEWDKLDPKHKLEPINFNGKSVYTKYPFLKDKSLNEKGYDDAHENYIKYKSKMLISMYACELYESINIIIHENPEIEVEVDFNKTKYLNKEISKYSNGINITTQEDLDFLKSTLDNCHAILNKARKEYDLEQVFNSFENLRKIMIDEYYYYSIKQK